MPLTEAALLYRVTAETMLAWVRQRRFTKRIELGDLDLS